MQESIPKAYKPWLVASVVVLVGSLGLLAAAVLAAFLFYAETTSPLWVIVLGAFAVLGVGLGFGGLFLLLVVAGISAFREGQRVEVIPPVHSRDDR